MTARHESRAGKVECNQRAREETAMVLLGHPSPALAPFVELFWHDDRYRSLTHREPVLPESTHFLRFAKHFGSRRDQHMLAIMRIHIG